MIRQMIAGFLIALAVGGCTHESEPAGEVYGMNGSDERRRGEGGVCGGIADLQCEDGLYCDFPPEARCGFGDLTGVCAAPPDACAKIDAPVCGCDGKMYGNNCEASSASVSVQDTAACE
jgi:hypothetical protein